MRPEVTFVSTNLPRRRALAMMIAAAGTGMVATAFPKSAHAAEAAKIAYLSADEAHKAALAGDIILLDIRRPEEWLETRVAEGAVGLDMTQENFVPTLVALRKANPDKPIAMICRTGNRTGYVTKALAKQGFPGLVDVSEGMAGGPNGTGWLKRGLPTYAGTLENVTARRNQLLP